MNAPPRAIGHRLARALRNVREAGQVRVAIIQRYLLLGYEILQAEGPGRLLERVRQRLRRQAPPTGALNPPRIEFLDAWGPLQFETPAEPLVSVIIPVHNQHLHTYNCLRSIANTGAGIPFEVIVVDDRSTDATGSMLAAMSGLCVVRTRDGSGFIHACNTGAAQARGRILVFLNNDTLVTPAWLDTLYETFEEQRDAGLIGVRLVYPDGRLQEAGGILWRDGSAWNYGRGDDPARPEYSYLREVDYSSGACIAVRRRVFQWVNGFSTEFAPAYYEDADLALKVRGIGFRVLYQPAVTVVHFEGASAGTRLASGMKRHQVVNQRKLAARWRPVLSTHRVNGSQPELEKERRVRKRALVVDMTIPRPDRDSGSIRMRALLGILGGMGFKVTFAAASLELDGEYGAALQRKGIEVLYAPYVDSIPAYLAHWGQRLDLIVLSRVDIAQRFLAAARRAAPTARILFDTVDLRFLREQRFAQLTRHALFDSAARAFERQELGLAAAADATLVVSTVERDLLHSRVPGLHVEVVSNIIEVPGCTAGFADREGIAFIGNFTHPPNVDAAVFLVQEIVPLFEQHGFTAPVYLVGASPPPKVMNLASSRVTVTGFLPDLAPLLRRCRMTVAPLRYGAGVKGKINLSMAHGVPVVATRVAAEGMHLADGQDVLLADKPDAIATAIARLHNDPGLWELLSANGVRNVRTWFSPARARAGLLRALTSGGG